MATFDTLLAADDALVDWILNAHPTNEDETARMREVLGLRTRLDQAINALVAHRLMLSADALRPEAQALAEATGKLQHVAQTIDRVQDVVRIGGTILEITAKILAFIAV